MELLLAPSPGDKARRKMSTYISTREEGREGGEMGPIAPALTARIPPDPRGQGCLVESGTGVGDPEGSALVGPLMIIPRPPQRLFARAAEG
ncbi:hypothetical protein Ancab_025128 [Ancistrocladus abbreviatus]